MDLILYERNFGHERVNSNKDCMAWVAISKNKKFNSGLLDLLERFHKVIERPAIN